MKRLSFLHCVFLPTFLRLIGHKCMGLPLTLYSVQLIYMSVSVSVSDGFDYVSFVILSEARECDFSSSVLLSQDYFGYSGSFAFLCKV